MARQQMVAGHADQRPTPCTPTHLQLWDIRSKRSSHTFAGKYPVTAVAFSEAGDQVYAGGIDNQVHVWELRKGAVSMSLAGHTDSITGESGGGGRWRGCVLRVVFGLVGSAGGGSAGWVLIPGCSLFR